MEVKSSLPRRVMRFYEWGSADSVPREVGKVWLEDGKVQWQFNIPYELPKVIRHPRTRVPFDRDKDPKGYFATIPYHYRGSYFWANLELE